jgi:hypothetical protein
MLERSESFGKPALYELGTDGFALTIRVHPAVVRFLEKRLHPQALPDFHPTETPDAVLRNIASRPLPRFIGPRNQQWGFGRRLYRRTVSGDDWTTWACPFYPIQSRRDPAVPAINVGWSRAYATSDTLQALFQTITLFPEETDARDPQLFTVFCGEADDDSLNSWNVCARISAAALEALRDAAVAEDCSRRVSSAMERLYRRLSSVERVESGKFSLELGTGWGLALRCPGDDCSMMASGTINLDASRELELVSRNVDTPIQQLTLLFGLAALEECLREAFKKAQSG